MAYAEMFFATQNAYLQELEQTFHQHGSDVQRMTEAADAAYLLARYYFGFESSQGRQAERNERIALSWMQRAAVLHHESARNFLISGLASDKNAYVTTSPKAFEKFCKKLMKSGDQRMAYDYAAALAGYKQFSELAFEIKQDNETALKYLNAALHGSDYSQAYAAFAMIAKGVLDDKWILPGSIADFIRLEADKGNVAAALILVWHFLSEQQKEQIGNCHYRVNDQEYPIKDFFGHWQIKGLSEQLTPSIDMVYQYVQLIKNKENMFNDLLDSIEIYLQK